MVSERVKSPAPAKTTASTCGISKMMFALVPACALIALAIVAVLPI